MTNEQLVEHMAETVYHGGHGMAFGPGVDMLIKNFHDRDHEANQDTLSHAHEEGR